MDIYSTYQTFITNRIAEPFSKANSEITVLMTVLPNIVSSYIRGRGRFNPVTTKTQVQLKSRKFHIRRYNVYSSFEKGKMVDCPGLVI